MPHVTFKLQFNIHTIWFKKMRETSINCQLFTLGHNPEPSSKPKTKNLHKGMQLGLLHCLLQKYNLISFAR